MKLLEISFRVDWLYKDTKALRYFNDIVAQQS